jgi:hypothetical protein
MHEVLRRGDGSQGRRYNRDSGVAFDAGIDVGFGRDLRDYYAGLGVSLGATDSWTH